MTPGPQPSNEWERVHFKYLCLPYEQVLLGSEPTAQGDGTMRRGQGCGAAGVVDSGGIGMPKAVCICELFIALMTGALCIVFLNPACCKPPKVFTLNIALPKCKAPHGCKDPQAVCFRLPVKVHPPNISTPLKKQPQI